MLELRAINKPWQFYERCKELLCFRAAMFQQYLAVLCYRILIGLQKATESWVD